MDPNTNVTPGVDPTALGAAPAPDPALAPTPAPEPVLAPAPAAEPALNPAADVANAALAGATPVVTTTDLNAADVPSEPALQTPVVDPTATQLDAVAAPAEQPADDGPVSLAPSADFQMGEVSTVSAVQNGADGNLAATADEVMVGAPLESTPMNPMDDPTVDQLANSDGGNEIQNGQAPADFNDPNAAAEAEAAANKNKDEEEDQEPIVAAAPVPGSIGSAKSYADIQRAEAEKAARAAAKQGKSLSLSKNTIIIIAIAVIAVIGIAVGAFVLLSGSSTPTPTATQTVPEFPEDDGEYSTLSCKRNLAIEEYGSYGAVSGMQENVFYFNSDKLDGLVTNFSYTYANRPLAEIARDTFMRDYGVEKEGKIPEHGTAGEVEEPETSDGEDSDATEAKTAAEMLHHYVWIDQYTVTHGMSIESVDIDAWLASDNYSDKTYGATEDGAAAPLLDGETEDDVETSETGEVVRNLDYYNRLQNSINYDCIITKGY